MVAYGWTLPDVLALTVPEIAWLYTELGKRPSLNMVGMSLLAASGPQKPDDNTLAKAGAVTDAEMIAKIKGMLPH